MFSASRILRIAWILLLLSCSVFAAEAHAVLVSVSPQEGAALTQSPARMVLRFNEPVRPHSVILAASDGSRHDLLSSAIGGKEVTILLPQDLPRGRFTVFWRAVSGDGHPIGGGSSFSIGMTHGHTVLLAERTDWNVPIALWLARSLLFAALFFGAGMAAYMIFLGALPRPAIQLAGIATFTGIMLVPCILCLNGMDALGLGFSRMFDSHVWMAACAPAFALAAAFSAMALTLAGLGLRIEGRRGKWLALAGLAAVPLVLCVGGHAATAVPQWLTRPAVFLHAAGFLFWIGSLPPLLFQLARDPSVAAAPLARFSRIAPWPVAMILVSGLALSAIQLGPQPEFWLSPYGAILAGKLILLVLALGLATWNRYWLTGPVLAGDGAAAARLRGSMKLEILLVLGVIALAAGWRFTVPPRALAAAHPPALVLHLHHGKLNADLSVAPGKVGANAVKLALRGERQLPVSVQEVGIALATPELNMQTEPQKLVPDAGGDWLLPNLTLPFAGAWTVEIEIRISRYELARMTGQLVISP